MDRCDANLLHDLEWHVSEDEVWGKLAEVTCQQFATDGSAPEGKEPFAWIILDNKGTDLAQCNGPHRQHLSNKPRVMEFFPS
jgi:hypothetical protein